MSWLDDGGFHIARDGASDSPSGGIGFRLSVYVGGGRTVTIPISKTDVQGIRREAGRALKEQGEES